MATLKAKAQVPLRVRALRLLARREYSRVELERKLAPHVADPAEVVSLIAEFERRGWLSEGRVVEQVVASRRRRYGAARIAHELREKGIGEDAVRAAVAGLRETEIDRAREVWRGKFGKLPQSTAERARQVRFLQSRGFSIETAMHVLRGGASHEEC
jgi:regulatory protein